MRFIRETDAVALRVHLDKTMGGPVLLDLFIEPKSAIAVSGQPECELCDETRALVEEVASLSSRITLTVHDVRDESGLARDLGVSRVPTLVLRGAARGVVRYLGIPAGLALGGLLADLATVSRGTTTLREESRMLLASVTKPVHVQVFMTMTCPHCQNVAGLAHQAAVESRYLTADVIEISEFPDLATEYKVRSVPMVVMNGTVQLVGAQSEAAFVDAVRRAAS
jgi:glutaredoxin-like protein